MKLTAKHRKAIRAMGLVHVECPREHMFTLADAGGDLVVTTHVGSDSRAAICTALNAIASEPEPVARAREALLRYAASVDAASVSDVDPLTMWSLSRAYYLAVRAAKEKRR